ncbi:hypothetical protein B0H19DRAFT_1251913 [Mycena capillaripes]|nr:hypothetical protein B0H19DRAFT_1251913 [Mycena capillaripes]
MRANENVITPPRVRDTDTACHVTRTPTFTLTRRLVCATPPRIPPPSPSPTPPRLQNGRRAKSISSSRGRTRCSTGRSILHRCPPLCPRRIPNPRSKTPSRSRKTDEKQMKGEPEADTDDPHSVLSGVGCGARWEKTPPTRERGSPAPAFSVPFLRFTFARVGGGERTGRIRVSGYVRLRSALPGATCTSSANEILVFSRIPVFATPSDAGDKDKAEDARWDISRTGPDGDGAREVLHHALGSPFPNLGKEEV